MNVGRHADTEIDWQTNDQTHTHTHTHTFSHPQTHTHTHTKTNKIKSPAGTFFFVETVPKGSNYKITRAGRGAEAAQNKLKGPAGPNYLFLKRFLRVPITRLLAQGGRRSETTQIKRSRRTDFLLNGP